MASGSIIDRQNFDPEQMFEIYLHNYMIKRGLLNTAEIFKIEAQVPNNYIVVDSPTGLLQEWWSVFYDVFNSSQGRDSEPSSSSNVPNMTDILSNDSPLRTPHMEMNDDTRIQQSQANFDFSNIMMAQSASCSRSLTPYNNENLEYLDKNIEPSLLDFIKSTNPDFLSGTVTPLDGPSETKNDEAPNLVPLFGMPLNNDVLTSLMPTPNYHQHCQVSKAQNQDAVLSQACRSITKKKSFTAARNSTKYSKQNSKIPETESSSNREMEVMHQINRTPEPQQIHIQPQNVEDCVDATEEENVDSFLLVENEHAITDHRIIPFNNLKPISETINRKNKDFSFEEVVSLPSSKKKVLSSHFSSDGKVLASVGHEKKVFIWNMKTFDYVTTQEMHSSIITDVRFKPGSTIFATSSFDRSVRLWDITEPARSFLNLTGHAEQVMSLDFHPRKMDILCSCDRNDTICLWNINKQVCMHTTKGGNKQVRFEPHYGKLLATATGNNIKIIDVETSNLVCNLKGHMKDVVSICWDESGEYVASISEDCARVWSDGKCIAELHSSGSMFQSCIFHPAYSNLLVIGGYESLELWSPSESNKTWIVPAHKGLIVGLAASPKDKLIASASHDHCVKIWK